MLDFKNERSYLNRGSLDGAHGENKKNQPG